VSAPKKHAKNTAGRGAPKKSAAATAGTSVTSKESLTSGVLKPRLKFGYVDVTGEFVIPPRFDAAGDFSEGLAAVQIKDLWGYIDRTGAVVIEPRFTTARRFECGHALVEPKGGGVDAIHYVDRTGAPAYARVGSLREGLAPVVSGELYASSGSVAFGLPVKGMTMGAIDVSGQLVIPLQFASLMPFTGGLARALDERGWGFVDRTGKWVITPRFKKVCDFSEDLAAFLAGGEGANATWGFADRNGDIVIPPRFSQVDDFVEGVAHVRAEGREVFIDRSGEIVLEVPAGLAVSPKYGTAHPVRFCSGYLRIYGEPYGYVGFMNREGKVTIEPRLRQATDFDGDVASVSDKPGEFVLIDRDGRPLHDRRYHSIGAFDNQGLALVMPLSREVGSPPLLGFIDRQGREIHAPIYTTVRAFGPEGFARAIRPGAGIVVLARDGRELPASSYPRPGEPSEWFPKSDGKKIGFCDLQNTMRIPPRYDARVEEGPYNAGSRFREGLAPVGMIVEVVDDEAGAYPFLFYGVRPNDWYEGLTYIVAFAEELDEKRRAGVVSQLKALLVKKGVTFESKPRWEQRWLLLDLDVRGSPERAFGTVAAALSVLHEQAPIAEVVNLTARDESDHPWEKWTVRRQRAPSESPSFGLRFGFFR
jgi:hypothetical protein